ncbi:MAG: autotransporter domain-containing protein [Verrucomicrobia bacterium]|nr:autotransporter domain-containing protein [Verrucomicrobiota bacterium]
MKTLMNLGGAAAALIVFSATGLAQNRTFTNQYTFGDSLSDSGNLFAATSALGAPTPRPPYVAGRYSNGSVFTELLGNSMALVATAPTSVKSSLNFAFGGATASGTSPLPPSMAVQIGLFQSRAIVPTKTDLFTVLFGANDMISVLSAPTTPTNPSSIDAAGVSAAATVAGGVQSLIGFGAKNIIVGGLPNLGATPRSLAAGATGAAFGLRAATAFNAELTNRLRTIAGAAPDVNVLYVDLQGALDRIVLDYKLLGYSNVTSFAIAPASAGGGADVGGYVFFDDIHPTAKTHALLASAIVEALNPEPVLGFAATQASSAFVLQSIEAGALDARIGQVAATNRAVGRADAYLTFNYGDGNRSADGYRQKFSYTAQVVTAGADMRVSDGFLAGGAINSGRLNASINRGGGNYKLEDLTGRVYGIWRGGPVSFAIDADYGNLDVKGIHRTTAFAGFQTNGKASGDHWGAGIKAMWTAETSGVNLRPWLGLRTERVKLHGYTEKDVPVDSMAFDGQSAKSSAGSVGVDLGTDTKLSGRVLHFDFRAAWHGEIGGNDRGVSGKLADNFTRTTTISVEDGDGRGVELGGAATLFFAKNWSASLGYAGDIRSGDKLASRASFSVQTGF